MVKYQGKDRTIFKLTRTFMFIRLVFSCILPSGVLPLHMIMKIKYCSVNACKLQNLKVLKSCVS